MPCHAENDLKKHSAKSYGALLLNNNAMSFDEEWFQHRSICQNLSKKTKMKKKTKRVFSYYTPEPEILSSILPLVTDGCCDGSALFDSYIIIWVLEQSLRTRKMMLQIYLFSSGLDSCSAQCLDQKSGHRGFYFPRCLLN